MVAAQEEQATVAAGYAEAFATVDFAALQRRRAEHDAAARRGAAAHERMERESLPSSSPASG